MVPGVFWTCSPMLVDPARDLPVFFWFVEAISTTRYTDPEYDLEYAAREHL